MKAVGAIRLGFQFMVGLLCKKANQQVLRKVFPRVGMFMRLSLVCNESWAHIAAFNKTAEDETARTELSAAQVGRCGNALRIPDFPWSQARATSRGRQRQQAGIALSTFLLCAILNSCSKWGCTQLSDETCLEFLRGLFWGHWGWLLNWGISTESPAKPQLQYLEFVMGKWSPVFKSGSKWAHLN